MQHLFSLPNIGNLPSAIVSIVQTFSLVCGFSHDSGVFVLEENIDYMGENPMHCQCRVSAEQFALQIVKDDETYIGFELFFDQELRDWVLSDRPTLCNVTYERGEFWRVLDELEEIAATIDREMEVEV